MSRRTTAATTQPAGWDRLAPSFTPPAEFARDDQAYRSPLKFYDGQPVQSADQWPRRRQEILDRWNDLMGHWPPLIEHPHVEVLAIEMRENFRQLRVRFNWLPEESTEGYLLIPEGTGPRPAVVTVFYEPETAIGRGKPNRDFAYQLARRGFVTLSIGTKEASEKRTYALYYPSLKNATIQPLSTLAYAAANAYFVLASRPEVDASRVGIVGHSFGGKWAMFASCLFDKFAAAVWSDPGIAFQENRESINYWEPWYLGYESGKSRKRGLITPENPAFGLYPRLRAEGLNLQELHALMAPRPFLVSGGSEDRPDRWRVLRHAVDVNNLLGFQNRVGMTNRPNHEPTADSNEMIYLFFEHFLNHKR